MKQIFWFFMIAFPVLTLSKNNNVIDDIRIKGLKNIRPLICILVYYCGNRSSFKKSSNY